LHDHVDAQRERRDAPEESARVLSGRGAGVWGDEERGGAGDLHEPGGEAFGGFAAPGFDELRDELYGPEDRTCDGSCR
jgi:hypothetical protein